MKTLLIASAVFLLLGCTQQVKECEPKKIYVKSKVPKLRTLYVVKPYRIQDFSSIDDTYIKVNKSELKKASNVSQKRIKNISFYERQNMKFNKEFAND